MFRRFEPGTPGLRFCPAQKPSAARLSPPQPRQQAEPRPAQVRPGEGTAEPQPQPNPAQALVWALPTLCQRLFLTGFRCSVLGPSRAQPTHPSPAQQPSPASPPKMGPLNLVRKSLWQSFGKAYRLGLGRAELAWAGLASARLSWASWPGLGWALGCAGPVSFGNPAPARLRPSGRAKTRPQTHPLKTGKRSGTVAPHGPKTHRKRSVAGAENGLTWARLAGLGWAGLHPWAKLWTTLDSFGSTSAPRQLGSSVLRRGRK